MAESLPTSVSAFSHRRARADSTTSFSFYQDEDELQESGEALALESGDARLSVDDIDELPFDDDFEEPDDSIDMGRNSADGEDVFLRPTSTQSRGSIRSRLLRRDSGVSAGSAYGANRYSQKVYMVNEDLYIVIAGFRTSPVGLA